MYNVILVTIQNPGNFGNRLQNYALQTVLEHLNCKVNNLSVNEIDTKTDHSFKNMLKKLLLICGIRRFLPGVSARLRRKQGIVFSKKRIHNYLIVPQDKLRCFDFNKYDYAITGSDQVWHNWKRIKNELSYYYLDFISKDKRIAYAPSFGFPEFPKDDKETHVTGLNGIKFLSSREQQGCELIYKLTGRLAQKVLDPTLLLSVDEWQDIEEKPKFNVSDKYLLLFMLGSISEEFWEEIKRISHFRKLVVLNISDLKNPLHYGISPAEFIWLIHHADTVCTDSFHATVFSIIFTKNLRVFERISPKFGNMFGRLHDLLMPLGLLRLVYSNETSEETDLSTCLGEKEREYLRDEQVTSINFLKDSLKIK